MIAHFEQASTDAKFRVTDTTTNARPWIDDQQIDDAANQAARRHVIWGWRNTDRTILELNEERSRSITADVRGWMLDDLAAASPDQAWRHEKALAILHLIRQTREQLPKQFIGIAYLQNSEPRTYALATDIVRTLHDLTEERGILRYLQSYQTVAPLNIAEIWCLPAMFSMALVDELQRLIQKINDQQWSRRSNLTADLNIADEAAMDITIASLRAVTSMDWSSIFESASLTEAVLRKDPDGTYPDMDSETRDRYRRTIQTLAKRTGEPEIEVARRAFELAEKGMSSSDPRHRHIGYYLIDRGRDQLEAAIGYRPRWRQALGRYALCHATPVYLGAISLLTGVAVCFAIAVAVIGGGSWMICLLAAVLSFIPASEIATSVVNYWVTKWLPLRTLPKLELKSGIPIDLQTMVVIPTMLLNDRQINNMLDTLESHFLANPEPNLSFALLTDFSDAPESRMPEDDELLATAVNGIRRLNDRYSSVGRSARRDDDSTERFFLFHRERRWNDADKVWMGWERKRGKLVEFNRLVLGASKTSYLRISDEVAARLTQTKYVITLDSDTILPHQSARRLVGTIAHPLNRPQLTKTDEGYCVTAGYSLLQPRIRISLAAAHQSSYSWLNVSGAGLNPYVTGASDVYQDLFQEGSFIGKGIYDVAAFQSTVDKVFPANHVLSHDLIEGCHARAGLVTDVELVDGFPARYDADARRTHRWTRGDWQLLPWLMPQVPTASGKRKNPLSLVSRWKVLDNLRRSIVPTALLILLIAGWTILPGSPWAWTAFAMLGPALPMVWDLSRLTRRHPDGTWKDHWRFVKEQTRRTIAQTFVSIALLPHRAQMMTDATIRALVRMMVTRRQLLEWETAAATEHRLAGSRWSMIMELWFPPLFAMAIATAALMGGLKGSAVIPAMSLAVLWFCSPLIAYFISQPTRQREVALSADQRRWLWEVARQTWSYFHAHVGPADHWLPPDNVQDGESPKVAHRISTTNEGLFLVSALAAHDLGILEAPELAKLIQLNLDTWEKLPQYRGHHFNWYDSTTLEPLNPRYISTVDNGNLLTCLLTVQQGLKEVAKRKEPGLRDQLLQLARRCCRMVQAMDFRFLFDAKRKLFHIGFNVDTQTLDAGHYDLLASEARLASYVAIAKGNVDHQHWFQLGRRMTKVGDRPCLMSWSGSMFEYLMPTLFIPTIRNSLLDVSCRAAIARHIEYGKQKGVPWGISESSFAELNDSQDFGYHAFGVPSIGLQQGLDRDLVIAPYASALALAFEADAATKNLQELAAAGALGRWGFVDAVDYTSRRLAEGQTHSIVPCYMAHHQGMTMVALANRLRDNCMIRRFRSHPAVHAVELILEERVPDGPIPEYIPTVEPVAAENPVVEVVPVDDDAPSTPPPPTMPASATAVVEDQSFPRERLSAAPAFSASPALNENMAIRSIVSLNGNLTSPPRD